MKEVIDLIKEPIINYLQRHGHVYLAENIELILVIIFCSGISPFIYKQIVRVKKYIGVRKAEKSLSPYITSDEINQATKYYINTKGQNVSPANELEPRSVHAFTAKNKLIDFFIKAINKDDNDSKHYLVLADSGMGKSTFMINFYLKYIGKLNRKYKIKLFPLGNPSVDTNIDAIKEKENTILLLDAFDEDPKAVNDYKIRLQHLIKKTWKFRYIFITSRSQFFPSEAEEPYNTGLYKFSLDNETRYYFKKIYISPFDDNDVRRYLKKKFPIFKFWLLNKRRRAFTIVQMSPNLMVRPMLLSYIDSLVENSAFKSLDVRSLKYLKISDIYKILIDRWIVREARRIDLSRREEFMSDMYRFSERLAIDMFMQRVIRGGLYIQANDITIFANENKINLSELELKGKSLLNRDASGVYKFAHKSILEFFLAKHASENRAFAEGVVHFNNLDGFDYAKKFYNEMYII